jgi:hypothetical protein
MALRILWIRPQRKNLNHGLLLGVQEDSKLTGLVAKHGPCNWSVIAEVRGRVLFLARAVLLASKTFVASVT